MTDLLGLREDLRKALEPLDVNTYNHLPARAALPSAVVLAGSPYLEHGQTFGEWTIRLEVWVSAAKGDNSSETDTGDELIQAAIEAIHNYDSPLLTDGWLVEGVSQSFEWEVNNGQAFTNAITVTSSVTFN